MKWKIEDERICFDLYDSESKNTPQYCHFKCNWTIDDELEAPELGDSELVKGVNDEYGMKKFKYPNLKINKV